MWVVRHSCTPQIFFPLRRRGTHQVFRVFEMPKAYFNWSVPVHSAYMNALDSTRKKPFPLRSIKCMFVFEKKMVKCNKSLEPAGEKKLHIGFPEKTRQILFCIQLLHYILCQKEIIYIYTM